MTIKIDEIFGPTIQGEGATIGKPTVFVRVGGCDYQHCSWCDTLHAVLPEYKSNWVTMRPGDIMAKVRELAPEPILITLSGGNPALYDGLEGLIRMGQRELYFFAMETQGSKPKDWLGSVDYLTISPKPPSSKMETDYDALADCVNIGLRSLVSSVSLKVVVFDDLDFEYALDIHSRFPSVSFFLSAGNDTSAPFDRSVVLGRLDWLVNKVTEAKLYKATVLPQLHTLIWGDVRGV